MSDKEEHDTSVDPIVDVDRIEDEELRADLEELHSALAADDGQRFTFESVVAEIEGNDE